MGGSDRRPTRMPWGGASGNRPDDKNRTLKEYDFSSAQFSSQLPPDRALPPAGRFHFLKAGTKTGNQKRPTPRARRGATAAKTVSDLKNKICFSSFWNIRARSNRRVAGSGAVTESCYVICNSGSCSAAARGCPFCSSAHYTTRSLAK